ncbi:class I SAM-dependent methyltransferase [Algibacter amylolyticus]|uniref:Class I SAM-dependent methyltransferase n=1 Tax=Algibacter amylolyticus TaxID=1608400 RepID=A0A5M7B9Q7_9FLAO|nr:class I SAM-dependent methyltransferase [Algibacter amylolyticus]KAA5824055.1 class I SAM-dependent methyltransferase [Algibacter amylolyticus]MBB5269608.1 hypothetical protein [Algibacter amylolyticus]TSJ74532.1 class I SAM-dependent methyltransferase [Algibacter amylolyticus]
MIKKQFHPASFRDSSGYVFLDEDVVKRVVNPIYFKQYRALKENEFFEKLFKLGLLIEHEEIASNATEIIIKPEKIPFFTYPYEWSFNQYKEAALLTLKLQKICLENNFSLKDASAFNITFYKGKAIFVDTLSFDFYKENSPWRSFKQFIEHFLGPLVLARYHGADALKLMTGFIDGIPLKLLSSMLPFKTKLNPFLYSNIHLLAKYEDKYSKDSKVNDKEVALSKNGQINIIKSLYNYIKKLSLKEDSEWGEYYDKTNYAVDAFNEKSKIINKWIDEIHVKTLIDVGGNDGTFVREIKSKLETALVCDIDNNAVDYNYKTLKTNKETNVLPFVLDVLSPTPAIGFNNKERDSFISRIAAFSPDVTLALALIHHMSLSGNVPFDKSAEFFATFSKHLIIEFPKRDDSWVAYLLKRKGDFSKHFDAYNIENFENSYFNYFDLVYKLPIKNTKRVMFFFKRKNE